MAGFGLQKPTISTVDISFAEEAQSQINNINENLSKLKTYIQWARTMYASDKLGKGNSANNSYIGLRNRIDTDNAASSELRQKIASNLEDVYPLTNYRIGNERFNPIQKKKDGSTGIYSGDNQYDAITQKYTDGTDRMIFGLNERAGVVSVLQQVYGEYNGDLADAKIALGKAETKDGDVAEKAENDELEKKNKEAQDVIDKGIDEAYANANTAFDPYNDKKGANYNDRATGEEYSVGEGANLY